jgi:hypothetical protein
MASEPIMKGKAQYVNLLNKVACFVKNKIMITILTVADLNLSIQGVQLYLVFPFSKGSLPE